MKTLVALFDDFADAQRAVDTLVEMGIDRNDISIVAQNASGQQTADVMVSDDGEDAVKAGQGATFGAVVGGLVGLGALLIPGIGPVIAAGPLVALLGAGIGAAAGAATGGITAALIKTGVSEHDAEYFADGLRQGGTLVTVNAGNAYVDQAQEILMDFGATNVNHSDGTATLGTTAQMGQQARSVTGSDQERLQVVEEELQVGKRDVERGGVRVSTYVTETPVEQDIELREERVNVQRVPVDRPANSADLDTFQDGVIEVTEHAEEAVVQKTARVVEEVVVGKEVQTRTETVSDTVRRKDVDVEYMGANGGSMSSASRTWDSYLPDFRARYDRNYASTGYTFDQYVPAFQYGYTLANDERYRDYDWSRLETDARTQWEAQHHDSPWEMFKDAVHDAWQSVRNAVTPQRSTY